VQIGGGLRSRGSASYRFRFPSSIEAFLGWPTSGEASSSGAERLAGRFLWWLAAALALPRRGRRPTLSSETSTVLSDVGSVSSSTFCFVPAEYPEAIVRNRFFLYRFPLLYFLPRGELLSNVPIMFKGTSDSSGATLSQPQCLEMITIYDLRSWNTRNTRY